MKNYFSQEKENYYKFGELLVPEDGFELEFLVGMTYSLDFKAMLSILLTIQGVSEDILLNGSNENKPAIYNAIEKNIKKVAIFCNASGIKLPKRVDKVYSLLDDSVFNISDKNIVNFHPKLYIILYKNKFNSKEMFKIVTMSKNLTFDQSLDVAASIKAEVSNGDKNINKDINENVAKPLIDMLDYVKGYANSEKHKEIEIIQEKLKHIGKLDFSDDFEECKFVPVGIKGYKDTSYKLTENAKKLIVISPFLTDGILKRITDGVKEKTLITRAEYVTKKVKELFDGSNDRIYVVKDEVLYDDSIKDICDSDEQAMFDEESDDPIVRDIHAKIIFRNTDDGDFLSLGSLNATNGAYEKNVEFMTEFKCRKNKKDEDNYSSIIDSLINGDKNIFKEYDMAPSTSDIDKDNKSIELNEIIKKISGAEVKKVNNNSYNIIVKADETNSELFIKPLFMDEKVKKTLDKVTEFQNATVDQLSELYHIEYNGIGLVIKINTQNIDKDERNKAVFQSSIVSSENDFSNYISYILSDNFYESKINKNVYEKNAHTKSYENIKIIEPAVFEKLLKYSFRDPNKIDEIIRICNWAKEKDGIVNEDFEKLINTFKEAIQNG